MPTGYTNYILDGKIDNGKDFLKLCTRAFGVATRIREKSLETPTPIEIQPDDFYKKRLEEAKENLDKYLNMTTEEAQKNIDEEHEKNIIDYTKYIEDKNKDRIKYEKVLKEVESWMPPTKEHEKLKKYALDQIEESIKWDCSTDFAFEIIKVPKPEVNEWLANKIEYYSKNIKRYTEYYNEEIKRVNERNKWMKDFIESLK